MEHREPRLIKVEGDLAVPAERYPDFYRRLTAILRQLRREASCG